MMRAVEIHLSRRECSGADCFRSLRRSIFTIWSITCIRLFRTKTGRGSPSDSTPILKKWELSPFGSGGDGQGRIHWPLAFAKRRQVFVPEGLAIIAQRFNVGTRRAVSASPGGTAEIHSGVSHAPISRMIGRRSLVLKTQWIWELT